MTVLNLKMKVKMVILMIRYYIHGILTVNYTRNLISHSLGEGHMIRRLLLVAVLLALILGSLSCGLEEKVKPSISGTYVCIESSEGSFGSFRRDDYFEFKKDETIYVRSGASGTIGEWELRGDEIVITIVIMGTTVAWKGEIEGNTIILDDGSRWVKEGEKTSAAAAPTTSPPGTAIIGDFTATLSSVERRESDAALSFTVTKSSDTGYKITTATVVLIDDHNNEYQGSLDITSSGGAPGSFLSLLPLGFTFVADVIINMPKTAPIVRFQLGTCETAFDSVQFVKPSLKQDYGNMSIQSGASVTLSKYLTFTPGTPTSDLIGWNLPITVANSDYNPLPVGINLLVQSADGKLSQVSMTGGSAPGSGKMTLQTRLLTISQGRDQGCPVAALIIFSSGSIQQSLKLLPLSPSQFPPVPERIVYWYYDLPSGSTSGIYVMKTDGTCITMLNNSYIVPFTYPTFSPDGTKIAFGAGQLQVMNADGSNIITIVKGNNPAWSPDGTKLAFIRSSNEGQDLCLVSATGSPSSMITVYHSKGGTSGTSLANPAWSPEGNKIAFNADGYIYLIGTDGSGLSKFAEGQTPAWSPDGKKIIFNSSSPYSGDIAVKNVDGTGLTILAPGKFYNPTYSPNGSKIVCCTQTSLTTQAIIVMSADGTGQKRFDIGVGAKSHPSWAPAFTLGVSTSERPSPSVTPSPSNAVANFEVANLDRSELLELRRVIEEALAYAKVLANQDQKQLLVQAEEVLAQIQAQTELRDLVAEKTEERRLILDLLEGLFSTGVEYFYKIPSPISEAMAKGAEELGNRIAEWQILGQLSFARVTDPDVGKMEVVYYKGRGEVWASFDTCNPAGQVCVYVPVEPALVSPAGGGNILLSKGVKPIAGKSRIAYRFSTASIPATPVKPIAGEIAFASDRDGNYEIYVMSVDGSNQTRLTNTTGDDSEPSWSPDSSRIVFSSTRDGNIEIYVMNADGSNQTRLTNNPAADYAPAWSPDGKRIAFTSIRDGNREIYIMNADGGNQTRLTSNTGWDFSPKWSPDGTKIVFSSDRQEHSGNTEIYFMNIDGSNQTRLTNSPGNDYYPLYSPDSDKIVFCSYRDNNWEIYLMNTDGSNPMRLTKNTVDDANPWWSFDSNKMVFCSLRDGNWEIYLMNADGSNQARLTNNPTQDVSPSWAPSK